MVYAYRGRRYARPAYRRRAPYRAYRGAYRRAPARRRGTFVPKRAFTRPKAAYRRGTGRFLKTKCAALRKRLVPYKEQLDPTNYLNTRRIPKAGFVYVAATSGPQSGKGRYFRKAAYVPMLSFLRRSGVTSPDHWDVVGSAADTAIVTGVIDHALTAQPNEQMLDA